MFFNRFGSLISPVKLASGIDGGIMLPSAICIPKGETHDASTISTRLPFTRSAALPSSVSTWNSVLKSLATLTCTLLNVRPFGPPTLTSTTWLSFMPKYRASSTLRCICLLALMAPSFKYTVPFGPTRTHDEEPEVSPDGLTGASMPSTIQSVFDSSTCVLLLKGPSTLTFWIAVSFGPTTVRVSLAAKPGL